MIIFKFEIMYLLDLKLLIIPMLEYFDLWNIFSQNSSNVLSCASLSTSQGIFLQLFSWPNMLPKFRMFSLNVDYSSRIRSQTLDKKLNGQYRIWIILVSRRITHLVFPLIFSSRIFSIRWGLSARLQTLTLFLYSNFFTGSYWGIYYL